MVSYTGPDRGNLDAYQLSRPQSGLLPGELPVIGAGPPRIRVWPDKDKTRPGHGFWSAEHWDGSAGLNLQVGQTQAQYDHARLARSSLVSYAPGQMTLPLAQVNTTQALGFTPKWMGKADIFGHTVMLIPDVAAGANKSLYRDTTAGGIVQSAYAPAATQTCVASVYINSIQNPQLLVGNSAGGFHLFTTLANFDAGTVSATVGWVGTTSISGVVQTATPRRTLVFLGVNPVLGGGMIFTLQDNADPLVGANYNLTAYPASGGYMLGLHAQGGEPLRVWMVIPRDNVATGALGAPTLCDFYSVNEQGEDPSTYSLQHLGMDGFYIGALWRGGLISSNYQKVVWTSGLDSRPIPFNKDRTHNSDRDIRVVNFRVINDNEIELEVNEIAQGSSTGATLLWYERYNFDKNAITAVSEVTTLSTTGILSIPFAASGGVIAPNGYSYGYADGKFRANLVPPAARDLLTLAQSIGADATTGSTFAASGAATWPVLHFPEPARDAYKWITGYHYGGALYNGQSVTASHAHTPSQTWTAPASESLHERSRLRPLRRNHSPFRDYQLTLTATLGTNTKTTPQVLPFTVFGEYEEVR